MNKIKWLLSYKGRLNRLSFFIYYLIANIIVSIFIYLLIEFSKDYFGNTIEFLLDCFLLFFLYGLSCLVAKRFHDMGKSNLAVIWWYPVGAMSILGYINSITNFMDGNNYWLIIALILAPVAMLLSIILFFRKGMIGKNVYGDDPLKNSHVLVNKIEYKNESSPLVIVVPNSVVPETQNEESSPLSIIIALLIAGLMIYFAVMY